MASEDTPDWLSNKRLFRWHGWLGLNLGLLLFVVCFSGTIAVFSWEIDWLIDPATRADHDTLNWTAMEDSLRDAHPNHVVSYLQGPRHDGFAAIAYATDAAGRSVKLWVHPETGSVQKRGNFWTVQRFFRSFHRRMFFPNPFGILWVTLFAFVLAGSAVTGVLFYKGWYRHLFRWRWKDVRLFFSDGHRLAGVWSLAFATIIVATAVWYGVELVAPADGFDAGEISEEALVERGPAPDMLPLGEQVERAKAAFPGLEPVDVIPGTAARATQVRGQADAWLVRPRANTVRIDPVTGEVLSVQDATEATAYHRWSDMADPLHFGTFGGLWSQAAWFLFGLLLSSLMLTGGWLWHLRAEKKARAAGAGRHPRWGYVAAAVPVIALLASGVYGYVEVEKYYMMREAPRQMEAQSLEVGPWQAKLLRMPPPDDGAASYRVLFSGSEDAVANLKDASLRWTGAPDSTAAERHPNAPVTSMLTDGPPTGTDSTLTIAGTTWDGDTHRDTVSAAATTNGSSVATASLPIPPVPTPVWIVIGLFVALTLGIVAAWLVLAQRTARQRAERGGEASDPEARAVPVSADLPTSK
ncbi:MAG: PepSY-associated TM helix domain-containing protein [Salinivenus sp.]